MPARRLNNRQAAAKRKQSAAAVCPRSLRSRRGRSLPPRSNADAPVCFRSCSTSGRPQVVNKRRPLSDATNLINNGEIVSCDTKTNTTGGQAGSTDSTTTSCSTTRLIRCASSCTGSSQDTEAPMSTKSIAKRYSLGRILGTGKCGQVWEGKDHQGRRYAIKPNQGKCPKGCAFDSEVEAVRAVQDIPGCISLVEHDSQYMVFPQADSDLFQVVQSSQMDGIWMPESQVREVLRSVLHTLVALHGHLRVVHADIKPENIFLMKEGTVCLGDMEWLTKFNVPREYAGTPGYIAPEVLEQYSAQCYGSQDINVTFTDKYDIWALGATAYTMLAHAMPFSSPSQNTMRRRARAGPQFKEEQWAAVSKEAQDFVSSLLQPCPAQRPSAESALQHPWMRDSTSTWH